MRARCMLLALLTLGLPGAGGAEEQGAQVLSTYCNVCHREDLVHQQRLSEKQWHATVDKMVRWGAPLNDAAMKETLVSYLAERYGPDAGPPAQRRIAPHTARAAVAPLPDAPFGDGDAARGEQLFGRSCVACHGPDARGQIGVNLVDRYLLDRAREFATIVREGKGKDQLMQGQPIDAAGIADLLAYLRGLARD